MKIPIINISDKLKTQKGFDDKGCLGTDCEDSCCKFGADFDIQVYEFLKKNQNLISLNINDCFEDFSGDSEYLGKNSIRSKVINGYCIFHNKDKRGCILYELLIKHNENKFVPSICKLFPITWNNGCLNISEYIPKDCNCVNENNKTNKNILETQLNFINEIFEMKKNKDKCVSCGKESLYFEDTHIDHRKYYVEGAGQLCETCYTKIFK